MSAVAILDPDVLNSENAVLAARIAQLFIGAGQLELDAVGARDLFFQVLRPGSDARLIADVSRLYPLEPEDPHVIAAFYLFAPIAGERRYIRVAVAPSGAITVTPTKAPPERNSEEVPPSVC